MLGWRGLHWPLTSPWKRRLQVGALSPGVVPADGGGIRRDSPSCSLAGSL